MPHRWEFTILDAAPFGAKALDSLAAADLDGDGRLEILVGGSAGLHWIRPDTLETGVIHDHYVHIGIDTDDMDGDGRLEVAVGQNNPSQELYWFKSGPRLSDPWTRHVIDPATVGAAHDLLFADIDGDGEKELLAEAVYCGEPGLYVYKKGPDPTLPWRKGCIQTGTVEEGLSAGDLDGDGRVEVVNGPDYYSVPPDGAFSGFWKKTIFAPDFREMCRTALIDITGNGRPDIVLVESEYNEGRVSWFENRIVEDPENPWVEHLMERGIVYGHSLDARRDPTTGEVRVMVGEMSQGGWGAPVNRGARILEFATTDGGETWSRTIVSRGEGSHEACYADLDGDGAPEILSKDAYEYIYGENRNPKLQLFKERSEPSPLASLRHRLLDRDKPSTATDILAADLDGDGSSDVLCGKWRYAYPGWERRDIPGIEQVHLAYDLDGDGLPEIVASKPKPGESHWYGRLSSELVWLKLIDPKNDVWEEHPIGQGTGDWAHGMRVAPVLPGGKLALLVGYHDATDQNHFPELFEIPDDPKSGPWKRRVLAEIPYGEELVACDIDGDGKLDLVAGSWWLENRGDGTFAPHRILEGYQAARLGVMDVNGDGRPDIVLGEESLDFENRITPKSKLVWLENPADPANDPWLAHVIDTVRCAHSLSVGDLDGDGEMEIAVGEHDPFWPYRSQCRLYVYKKADAAGRTWKRFEADDRFEHHDGAKIVEIAPGRVGIVSHGWTDSIYVHLWEPER